MSYNGLGIIIIGGKEHGSSWRLAPMRNAQVFGATAADAPTPTTPCVDAGRFRNPVDLMCSCPPGTHVAAGKDESCVPNSITGRSFYFPDCKDAASNKVPGCFMGFPIKSTAVTLGAGAVLGLVLSALLRG